MRVNSKQYEQLTRPAAGTPERTQLDYDEACLHAAKLQGVLDAVDLLHEHGIDAELQQTGGFVMTVGVFRDDDMYLYVSPGHTWNSGDGWLVCQYDGTIDCDEGIALAENATDDEMVSIVEAFLSERRSPVSSILDPLPDWCDYCEQHGHTFDACPYRADEAQVTP